MESLIILVNAPGSKLGALDMSFLKISLAFGFYFRNRAIGLVVHVVGMNHDLS